MTIPAGDSNADLPDFVVASDDLNELAIEALFIDMTGATHGSDLPSVGLMVDHNEVNYIEILIRDDPDDDKPVSVDFKRSRIGVVLNGSTEVEFEVTNFPTFPLQLNFDYVNHNDEFTPSSCLTPPSGSSFVGTHPSIDKTHWDPEQRRDPSLDATHLSVLLMPADSPPPDNIYTATLIGKP